MAKNRFVYMIDSLTSKEMKTLREAIETHKTIMLNDLCNDTGLEDDEIELQYKLRQRFEREMGSLVEKVNKVRRYVVTAENDRE